MSFSYLTIGVGQGDEIPLGGPRHIQDGIRELFLPNLPKGTHCNPKSEKGQIAWMAQFTCSTIWLCLEGHNSATQTVKRQSEDYFVVCF